MAKIETKVDVTGMIDAMVDYRVGQTNMKSATKELQETTGLPVEVCEVLLKEMRRHNVTQIRGYSNEPERLRKGKKGKSNEAVR